MSQFPQHKFNSKVWRDGPGFRLVSFSLIKTTTYPDEEKAQYIGNRLRMLKEAVFDGQIRVPYFEYEVIDNEVTYQCEYIKGRQITKDYMRVLKRELLERENPWTFSDVAPANFVQDTYHEGIKNGTAPIYAIDLDSYGYYPSMKERIDIWNAKVERRGWHDLIINKANHPYYK